MHKILRIKGQKIKEPWDVSNSGIEIQLYFKVQDLYALESMYNWKELAFFTNLHTHQRKKNKLT